MIGRILEWLAMAVIFALAAAVFFFIYHDYTDCKERGGELVRKAVGAICMKVEAL